MRALLSMLLVLSFASTECTTGPSGKGCKTRWFDRDDPSGVGDYETLSNLLQEYPGQLCAKPLGIEVQTLDGSPLQTSLIHSDTTNGFSCQNKYDPPAEMCKDYKVRFTCPDNFCSGCKTRWFDRDDPSGVGDYETLSNLLQENPGQLCSNPIGIEARTLDGSPLQTSLIQYYDTASGFGCMNKYDPPAEMCKDYKVQFTCPDSFCSVCTTRWFDRDDPSGKGDYETLSDLLTEFPNQLCANPIGIKAQTLDGILAVSSGQNSLIQYYDPTTGFVCQNQLSAPVQLCKDYEVQFTCPKSFCSGCKTQWFDRDDPSGYGDYETLSNLLQEYPGQLCANPLEIEVQTLDGSPLQTSLIQYSDTTTGFVCLNKLTPPVLFCKDYKVRFSCPQSFCQGKGR
ncbi:uncharacterized protein LOC115076727 [Rhinatrema bivittatum]|uniref:uncharacterized protein LOC115076727 n=1 Tax=Rhinatrema bivittatum TaxID=194408 RepID=UPI00112D9D90|nr:uncharacterized protein LOC115076727 [Rhinatrema bivittatum]